jgi:hypothetical protein
MNNDSRIPVIVGVGEITDKPANPADGLEPLALMAEALKRAEQDAGAKLVAQIDSIDLVNLVSWRYEDPARQLCERLGIAPKRAVYGPVGGEGPIRYLHEAALRIQRGESVVAALCGAEAQSTVNKAEKPASSCHGRRLPSTACNRCAARAGSIRWRSRWACSSRSRSIRSTMRQPQRIGARRRGRRCANPANCGRRSRASRPTTRIRG